MAASLRSRLGRALLLALIPVLLLGFAAAFSGYRDEAQDRRELLRLTALRSAAEARVRLESAASILSVVAAETDAIDCERRFTAVAQRLRGYRNLIRYDQTLQLSCASAPVDGAFTSALGPAFRALEAGAPVVAVEILDGDDPVLIAASRVERIDGAFDGALVSVIDPTSLRTLVNPRTLPADTRAVVADRAGLLLSEAGRRDYGALLRAATPPDGEVRFARLRTESGSRDVAVAPLLGDDLVLLLSAPAQSPLSWARLNLLVGIGVPLLAFAAAFAAVYTAADRLVIRWLAYLERVAAVYTKGRYSVRPTVADDAPAEIRSLADSMGAMADAVTSRDNALRESIAQKDALLREIHHRVKNNLQVITSLLNLQQRALTDPVGRAVLADTRQRISALALIYRAMYQSEDLRRVEVRGFLEELVGQLVNSDARDQRIRADVVADELLLDPDKLAPFALFTVEAVTNAQKHAFAGGDGAITVRFSVAGDQAALEVRDDGVGLSPTSVQGGVGRTLMNAFARQLRGRSEVTAPDEGGVSVRLTFPIDPAMQTPD